MRKLLLRRGQAAGSVRRIEGSKGQVAKFMNGTCMAYWPDVHAAEPRVGLLGRGDVGHPSEPVPTTPEAMESSWRGLSAATAKLRRFIFGNFHVVGHNLKKHI